MSLQPGKNIFKDYPNNVFVETGTYRGDGVWAALDAGFKKIISIDIDPEAMEFCKSRFDMVNKYLDDTIELITGDSAVCLYDTIKTIKEPVTFWLDSHWQMFEGTDPGKNPFPLLDELKQIARHKIKDHTIIIDDMLIMQKDITGYDYSDIHRELMIVNRNYKLTRLANPVINGILVAQP